MKPPFHLWLSYWIRSYKTATKQVLVFRRRNVFTNKWKSLTTQQVRDLANYLAMYGIVICDIKKDYVLFFFKLFRGSYRLEDVYLNFIGNDWHSITDHDSEFNYDIDSYDKMYDFVAELIEDDIYDDIEDDFEDDIYDDIEENNYIDELLNSNTKVESSIHEKVFVEDTIEETSNDNAFDALEPINDYSLESYVTSIDSEVPSYEDSSNDRCDSCESCDCNDTCDCDDE